MSIKAAKRLEGHLTVAATIECRICGAHEKANELCLNDLADAVLRFYRLGWRQLTSRKYQTQCAMCPTCAQAKDCDR